MSASGSPKSNRFELTIPNILTLLRMAIIPFFVFVSFERFFTLAMALFIVAGLTDIVDGYIARRLNQRSRFGALLDPAADKTLMFSGYIVYTLPGLAAERLPGWLTFTIFARDVLIVLFAYLLYTRVHVRRFPPSAAGKASTLFQVVALSAAIASNTVLAPVIIPLQRPIYAVALLLTLYSGFDYLRRADAMLPSV